MFSQDFCWVRCTYTGHDVLSRASDQTLGLQVWFGIRCCDAGMVLFWLVYNGRLSNSHLGTPCQSVTLARRVPIRSFEWPRGLPKVAQWQQELLDIGNTLIEWSILFFVHLDRYDCFGSMENPWPSYIWIQQCVRLLWWSVGWALVVYSNQPYGTIYQKLTGVLHNTPTLHGWSSRRTRRRN